MAEVIVLQPGYAIWEDKMKAQRADGTITLVKSSQNIIIDTGLPKDKEAILQGLANNALSVDDVSYVICTHGDADHTSNNNLFPHAKLIVGFDIYKDDVAIFFEEELGIDEDVEVVGMTGHDDRSVGVVVRAEEGIIAITGDLFEYEGDWNDISNWIAFSKNPNDQIKNRAKVWRLSDYIVPGHGDIFKVDKSIDLFTIESSALKTTRMLDNVYGDTTTLDPLNG